jgi:hypothetical protein
MNTSGDDRRGRVRLTGPARPTRLVGEPNVLSDAAVPNTLATPISRPTRVQPATRAAGESRLPTDAGAQTARVRLPSFGTVIFLGFLAVTAFRLFGQFIDGLGEATAPPAIVAPGQAAVPGSIVFGTESDGDCGVLGRGYEFASGSEVWWSARLSSGQAPDAVVVVITYRAGAEVAREEVPADPSFGVWSVLCSVKPVDASAAGTYRIEVRDVSGTVVHAVGEFQLAGA